MNDSTSSTTEAGEPGSDEIVVAAAVNGHRRPSRAADTVKALQSSPPRHTRDDVNGSPAATGAIAKNERSMANGDGEDGGDSEAETLIDSPVKKLEAEKQQKVKMERPHKHRIGGLPVPTDNDDDNDSTAMSPAPSTVMSVEKSSQEGTGNDNTARDGDDDSDDLSSIRSQAASKDSSIERAESERPGSSRTVETSPNPRKRKHRASSVSLPNKRPSIDVPTRRLRGLHSEGVDRTNRSLSPKLRGHRRAASTQSALMDGSGDHVSRKRRPAPQGPAKDSKLSRSAWEESDGSSETTSYGQGDYKRPPRGIGRSTSTPGRPAGREHKRHVNKYGFTKLAEACDAGDLDLVKLWREKDPEQLEIAEFAGNKPLQIAALSGNADVVDYLISEGCQIDCANVDKDTPLIDAAENGHLDVVHSLLKAGVDPLRQNVKGQQALDVVTDEADDHDEIRAALRKAIEEWTSTGAKQKREEEEESRHRAGPTKELLFMARSYENLLKLVVNNDRNGVREFLDARVPVDNVIIAAAAKTGDSYLVNMLLVELPEKKRGQKPEKPLLSVLGTSHFEMVRSLTELEHFNPLYTNRQGKTWPEIAEERRGPNWRQEQELLQRLYDQRALTKERRSSSPVTKRDSGKRHYLHRATDEPESDDEIVPRRKNGRKLMSKKEMRVAREKAAASDASSSDEMDSEVANGPEISEESSMKPPESPFTKRTPTRARTTSLSAQPPETLPRLRSRSSSLRASNESALPTLDENSEDKTPDEQLEEETRRVAEEAEEAHKLEIKRKEEEQAEAEAAAKRVAEEEAREAEERRQAEQARQEEARRAEEARVIEEERLRKEQEMAEARRLHRKQIIASLPRTISHVLSPESGFDYADDHGPTYIVHHFGPLQVLQHERRDSVGPQASGPEDIYWVANIQAAPFLGPRGVELLLRADVHGFKGSLADTWETRDVYRDDMDIIESILADLPHDVGDQEPLPNADGSAASSFEVELQRIAARVNAAASTRRSLRDGEAVMRYVRLDDVLKNVHPALQQTRINVRFDELDLRSAVSKNKDADFLPWLGSVLEQKPRPRWYVNGVCVSADTTPVMGTTAVRVVHQK